MLKVLETASVPYEVFSDVKPNPTVANVKAGLQAFAASGADFILQSVAVHRSILPRRSVL